MALTARSSDGTCRARLKQAPAGSAAAIANMDLHITKPVGKNGERNGNNVLAVQKALNRVPPDLGGPAIKLVEDGIVGPKTQGAIDSFQRLHFGSDKADGTIDVRNRTQAKISSLQPTKLARMAKAETHLEAAKRCIRAAEAKIAMAFAENVGAPPVAGALALVDKHFAIKKSANQNYVLSFIQSVFRDMAGVFARTGMFGNTGFSMYFEAEPFTNPDLFAFTWYSGYREMGVYGGVQDDNGLDQAWFRHDTIYLSAFYDATTDDDRVQTIVHELAHFVGPESTSSDRVTDNAYGDFDRPAMVALDTDKRIHNAECYGNFAFDAQFNRMPAHKK